jgi:Zn-finger domain-containing protein
VQNKPSGAHIVWLGQLAAPLNSRKRKKELKKKELKKEDLVKLTRLEV